ncbi:unnamed protein product [Owenia fusiformis]|uniref:Fe2OG dioxygenase domain-containing protein n=1 Tax=Owenia fusiformis TaxID=6347 RepID=A0A8S4PD07_OWEFU|nr:unnamed protein product [Owenia fusiformis]
MVRKGHRGTPRPLHLYPSAMQQRDAMSIRMRKGLYHISQFDAEHNPTDEQLQELAEDVYKALTGVGFMYIKNHGIPADLLKRMESIGREFFSLPREEKEKCGFTKDGKFGYSGVATETHGGSADVKEVFDYEYWLPSRWPKSVKYFEETYTEMFREFTTLFMRVLEVMALSLNLERTFFTKLHNTFTKKTRTLLRILNYPKMPEDFKKSESQMRLGGHTDWGTVSFIAQDNVGGLQIKSLSGDWIDATPKDGCLLVLIGDLMQRWTSDTFQANPHRSMKLPCEPVDMRGGEKSRFSMVYFGNSDSDAMIGSIGDSKYEPINAGEYYEKLLTEAFGY